MRDQSKPCQENFYQGTVRIEFGEPFSEPCLPCGPLVGDLNNCYKHSNISYGDPFGKGFGVRGGGWGRMRGIGEKFNLSKVDKLGCI